MGRPRPGDLGSPAAARSGRRETQELWAGVRQGDVPSHNYGLASPTFGARMPDGRRMSFEDANAYVQRFNAPTREALYGPGNDPAAAHGTVSRPNAGTLPYPLDHGGNVTLEHGDGFARNTTIPGEHPLEGTITRNLIVDEREGGGYQVMTLGRGEGGAELASGAGRIAGWPIGEGAGGARTAQNESHLMNPELGRSVFSRLDQSMLAAVDGRMNPNNLERMIRSVSPTGVLEGLAHEAYGAARAAVRGRNQRDNPEAVRPGEGDPAYQLVYAVARMLNANGSVSGHFRIPRDDEGIYFNGEGGTRHFVRGPDGQIVER